MKILPLAKIYDRMAAFGILGALVIGCASVSALDNFKKRCAQSGGIYMDCAAAFSEACSRAQAIDGKNVVCSCPETTAWDTVKGCVK